MAVNQYIKCPLCQFLARTTDMLQTHINSEHIFQNKVYTELKPLNSLYSSSPEEQEQQQPFQILNLMSHNMQQQQQQYYGIISSSQMNVSPPKNVMNLGNSSLSITPVQNEPKNLTKSVSKPPSPQQPQQQPVEQQQQPQLQQEQQQQQLQQQPQLQQQQTQGQNLVSKINLVTVEPTFGAESSTKPKIRDPRAANGEKHLKCEYCHKDFR